VAYFNLKTANATEAAAKARNIYVFLIANGWEATLGKFKPKPAQDGCVLSPPEFCDHFREALKMVEYPPLKRTGERYIKSFLYICRETQVENIKHLNTAKLKEFKAKYLKRGREEKRDENSVKVSCNAILRSAAAMFSKQMMEAYSTMQFDVQNPFPGMTLRRVEIQPYTPMDRNLLDVIWENSIKLRDGYPKPEVDNRLVTCNQASIANQHKARRWTMPDWHDPHPEAFVILLLELGIGLRRNEADWCQWDWFFQDAKGRRYIEIKKTKYFTPKGKRRRVIPVEAVIWNAIHEYYQEGDVFVVPGNPPISYTPETEPNNVPYRCERHHRTLVAWLRMKGINDQKPCHLLRKEFGSYVATSFGLFAAQRLLGHSSSTVTEAFYAGLTNLPELNHARIPVQPPALA
jgi:integrase